MRADGETCLSACSRDVATRRSQLQKLLDFTNKRYDVLFAIDVLAFNLRVLEKHDLKKIKYLLDDLIINNKKKKIFHNNLLLQYLQKRWIHYIKIYPFCDLSQIPLLFSMPGYKLKIFNARFQVGKLLRIVGLIKSHIS
jgi:hypothetical protein